MTDLGAGVDDEELCTPLTEVVSDGEPCLTCTDHQDVQLAVLVLPATLGISAHLGAGCSSDPAASTEAARNWSMASAIWGEWVQWR